MTGGNFDRTLDTWPDRYLGVLRAELKRVGHAGSELRAVGQQNLTTLLRHARDHSPWHAERLRGIPIDHLSRANLDALPTMTKSDLMDCWDDVVTVPDITLARARAHLNAVRSTRFSLLDERYVVAESSGSTGEPGVVLWDADDLLVATAKSDRYFLAGHREAFGLAQTPKIAWIYSMSSVHLSYAMTQLTGGLSPNAHVLPPSGPIARLADRLNDIQPDIVSGIPSVIYELALQARSLGLHIKPSRMYTTGEMLTEEMRDTIRDSFSIDIQQSYSATECPSMALQSDPAGREMLVVDDKVILEPVDAKGRIVPPGTPCDKVLMTNLLNMATPLIRYELTDRMTFLDSIDPPGPRRIRINEIHGRYRDLFRYGAVVVHPVTFSRVLLGEENIAQCDVIKTDLGVELAVLTHDTSFDAARLQRNVADALQDLGLSQPVVTVEMRRPDAENSSKKRMRFFPLGGVEARSGEPRSSFAED